MYFKRIQEKPVLRYGLMDENEFLFSTSRETMFRCKDINSSQTKIDADEILKYEKEVLLSRMCGYLAKAERSPAALKRWLSFRRLSEELENELTEYAINHNYLNPLRFAEAYLSTAEQKGNKSYLVLLNELSIKGVERSVANNIEYNEKKALLNYIRSYKIFEKYSREVAFMRLEQKGYSYSLIKEVFCDSE